MKILKILLINFALFVIYFSFAALADWIYVKKVLHWSSFALEWGFPAILWSAIPVTCYVNWRLLSIEDPRKRLVYGILLGLLAVAIAFVPYSILGLLFHLQIGGSL